MMPQRQRQLLGLTLGILLLATVLPVSQAAPAESFTKTVLKNGLTVYYRVIEDEPLVSVYAIFPIGMNLEQEKGAAHLLEHLVFRGGSGYSFQDIAAVTSRQGGYFNGFTSFYATAYNYIVPREGFSNALKVFNGSIWKTGLSESVVELERRIVIQELDMDYSDRYQYYPVYRYLFPEFRYSKSTVAAISPQDLQQFHQLYYQPGNATYVIAGDFKPEVVLAELEQAVNGYGSGPVSQAPLVEFSLPQGEVTESRNLYPYQFQLLMGYEFSDLTPKQRMVLKLLAYIYGYQAQIDYQRNEYQVYNAITRSLGKKDYFGLYYLERNKPYSVAAEQQERANLQKFIREFKKIDFAKELRNFIKLIELEAVTSQTGAPEAVDYQVQRLVNPDNITIDSLPLLRKLTKQDLQQVVEQCFGKPPTTWILVKTTK